MTWASKYGIWLGRRRESADIIKYLESRIEDLDICLKNDSCKDIAYVLRGIVEDIKYGEHK
jgi:hypothetical protein